MKSGSDSNIITEFAALILKTCSYLTDDNEEHKKARDIKKCAIKLKLKFEEYKHCLESTQLDNKIND